MRLSEVNKQEGITKLSTVLAESETPPASPSFSMAKVGDIGAIAAADTKKITDTIARRSPDIDYSGEGMFSTKALLAGMRNDAERDAALKMSFGEGNYGTDNLGRLWVRGKDGVKKSVFPDIGGFMSETPAEIVGNSPIVGGSIVGAAGGGIATGGNPLGVLGGSMIGAGTGYALQEQIKQARGLSKQTRQENIKNIRNEIALAGAGEVAGPFIARTVRGIGNIPKKLAGTPEDIKPIVNRLLDKGVVPPLASTAEGFKISQYHQAKRNMALGDPLTKSRINYAEKEVSDFLNNAGFPEEDVPAIMSEIKNDAVELGFIEENRGLIKQAQSAVKSKINEAQTYLSDAEKIASLELKKFQYAAKTSPEMTRVVAEDILQSRSNMSSAYGRMYDRIDQMTENKPIISTLALKKEVADIVSETPPAAIPAVYNRILKMPDRVSVGEMHRIRSTLKQNAMSSNLVPDVQNYLFGRAADVADYSFNMAQKQIERSPEFSSGAYKDAIPFMRKVDAMYKRDIAKFDDAVINKLSKAAKEGGYAPNPSNLAQQLIDSGNDSRLIGVVGMLSPQGRKAVGASALESLFKSRTKNSVTLDGKISARELFSDIQSIEPSLNAAFEPVYGKTFVPQLKEAVKKLAAVDGSLTADELSSLSTKFEPGAFLDAINNRIAALNEVDSIVKDNPLNFLLKGSADEQDRAIYNILASESRTLEAPRFFGEGSKEMADIRRAAIKALVKKATYRSDGGTVLINGEAMRKQLGTFTKKQQEILFPHGLNKRMVDLADEMAVLFPGFGAADFGTSLGAASVKAGIPSLNAKRWYDAFNVWFWGKVTDNPSFHRWLVGDVVNRPAGERLVNPYGFGAAQPPKNPFTRVYSAPMTEFLMRQYLKNAAASKARYDYNELQNEPPVQP